MNSTPPSSSSSNRTVSKQPNRNSANGKSLEANIDASLASSSSSFANSSLVTRAPSSVGLQASPSTQLLSGTLVIQSTPAAVKEAAIPPISPTGVNRPAAEAYKGSEIKEGEGFKESRTSRRAAKGQSRDELRQAFSVFDTSGKGTITTAEFAVVFKMLSRGMDTVSDATLNEMIAELDENGDNQITFDEFAALMTRRSAANPHGDGMDPLDDALSVFDTSDTKITKMEVKEVSHICQLLKENLTEEEFDSLIKEMPMDPDGLINYSRLVHQLMPEYHGN